MFLSATLPSKSFVFNFAASSSLLAFFVTKISTLPANAKKKVFKIGHQAEAYLQTNQTLIQYNGLFLSGFQ